jgi:hypothetical protein
MTNEPQTVRSALSEVWGWEKITLGGPARAFQMALR